MHATRELTVSPQVAAHYWPVYEAAFAPLAEQAPARQSFTREEFLAEMQDQRVLKFALRGDEVVPVAIALVATDLSALPWVSEPYYAKRYPEQHARRALYYFGALLVAEPSQQEGCAKRLLAELENFVVANHGVALFDCSDVANQFLPQLIEETTRLQADLDPQYLGAQHYYGYEARGFKPGFSPGKPFGEAISA